MKIAGNGGLNPIQGGNDGCFTGVALFLVLVQVYLPIKSYLLCSSESNQQLSQPCSAELAGEMDCKHDEKLLH